MFPRPISSCLLLRLTSATPQPPPAPQPSRFLPAKLPARPQRGHPGPSGARIHCSFSSSRSGFNDTSSGTPAPPPPGRLGLPAAQTSPLGA